MNAVAEIKESSLDDNTTIILAINAIERLEDQIKLRREEIKDNMKMLKSRGIHVEAVKMALKRRKYHPEDLELIDLSMASICRISALGIQGDLFSNGGGVLEGANRTTSGAIGMP